MGVFIFKKKSVLIGHVFGVSAENVIIPFFSTRIALVFIPFCSSLPVDCAESGNFSLAVFFGQFIFVFVSRTCWARWPA